MRHLWKESPKFGTSFAKEILRKWAAGTTGRGEVEQETVRVSDDCPVLAGSVLTALPMGSSLPSILPTSIPKSFQTEVVSLIKGNSSASAWSPAATAGVVWGGGERG